MEFRNLLSESEQESVIKIAVGYDFSNKANLKPICHSNQIELRVI